MKQRILTLFNSLESNTLPRPGIHLVTVKRAEIIEDHQRETLRLVLYVDGYDTFLAHFYDSADPNSPSSKAFAAFRNSVGVTRPIGDVSDLVGLRGWAETKIKGPYCLVKWWLTGEQALEARGS